MTSAGASLRSLRQTVAGWGLPGAVVPEGPIPVEAAEMAAIRGWAHDERLDGLLWAAVEGGAFDLDDTMTEAVRDDHLRGLRATLTVEAVAADVVTHLGAAGLASRLLKGIAAAHLDYPDPAWRSCFDTDVLVPRQHLMDAVDVLVAAGYRRAEPGLAPWWEQRFARAVVVEAPNGVEVDLHASIATGYFGTAFDHDALLAGPGAPVMLGGVAATGLPGVVRLLASCYSVVLGRGGHVRLWRDIAQQLLVSGCDWEAAVALAATGDGTVVLAEALRGMVAATGVGDDHPARQWAAGVCPSERAQRAMAHATAAEEQGFASDARSTLLGLGWGDRARFIAGLAFPPAASRRQRRRSVTGHLRRGVAAMRRPA